MNKFLRYFKEVSLGLFYFTAGIALMFFPKIAKILDLPYVNTEELINQQWHFWFGLVLSIVSASIIIYRFFHAKKLCIIKVDGMNGKALKTETVRSLARQEFAFYNINIDGEHNQKTIYQAYVEMKTVFKVNEEKGLYDEYIFYGFNYTPFLFMLGQLYADNRSYRFYHMKQTNDSEKRIRLSVHFEQKDGNELNDPIFTERNSDVLVIRVGTTVPANKMDITQFGDVDTLDLSSKVTGTEVINSSKRLFKWCDIIVKEIRKIDTHKYTTINLLLATSAEMVFLLGKRLSKNADPDLYVYHYDANTKHKYSWALRSKQANNHENVVTVFNPRKE